MNGYIRGGRSSLDTLDFGGLICDPNAQNDLVEAMEVVLNLQLITGRNGKLRKNKNGEF